ncbi:hypothetical protein DFJ73DRAFT_900307 [Zopfochytrium polystomum]|nr:hypothetical protein DFJ73DRAFT_900307 [Zopfochytrium polystomum]
MPPSGVPLGGPVLSSTTVYACTAADATTATSATVLAALVAFLTWIVAVGTRTILCGREPLDANHWVWVFILAAYGLFFLAVFGNLFGPLNMAWCSSADYRDCRRLNLGGFNPKQPLHVMWSLPKNGQR